jgi:hypothetical protein
LTIAGSWADFIGAHLGWEVEDPALPDKRAICLPGRAALIGYIVIVDWPTITLIRRS